MHAPTRHAGFAALAFVLIIIVVATVLAGGIAQVGANDQKEMAHEWRSRQAAAAAESGLARALVYLRQNGALVNSTADGGWMHGGEERWAPCRDDDTAPPCGDGKRNVFDGDWTAVRGVPHLGGFEASAGVDVHLVTRAATAGSARPGEGLYELIADARSEDGSASALVRKVLRFYPYLAHPPEVPLLVDGTLSFSGLLSIVAHPNGGGPGIALSAWTREDIRWNSARSCQIAEYLSTGSALSVQQEPGGLQLSVCADCACPDEQDLQLSGEGREGIDLLDVDGDAGSQTSNPDSRRFPVDVVAHVFGVAPDDISTLKAQAQPLAGCAGLNAGSSGLQWMQGDCRVAAGAVVGDLSSPLLLVVEDGTLSLGDHAAFIGVVLLLQREGSHRVQLGAGAVLYGALLSNRSLAIDAAAASIRYERAVLDVLHRGGAQAAAGVVEVPGSWTNYRQP